MSRNVVVNSVIENDDIVYSEDCKPKPKPEPKPEPEKECCCKTYNVTLHFH